MKYELNEYSLTPKELFKLFILQGFKNTWVFYLLFIVVCFFIFIIQLLNNKLTYTSFNLLLAVIVPLYYILNYYLITHNKKNKLFYKKKKIKFIDDSLIASVEDVGNENILLENIIKVTKLSSYIKLYFSTESSLIIPERAFKDNLEFNTFYKEIKNYIKEN